MKKIRCSFLPIAAVCGQSLNCDKPMYSTNDEVAGIGSAVHAVNAGYVKDATFDAQTAIAEFNLEDYQIKEVNWLSGVAVKWWKNFNEQVQLVGLSLDVEKELQFLYEQIELTGHIDVVAIDTVGVLHIVDWKMGPDKNYIEQMRGYAALAFGHYSGSTYAIIHVVHLVENRENTYSFTIKEISDWLQTLEKKVTATAGAAYNVNPSCVFCPRSMNCPAREAQLRHTLAVIAPEGELAQLEHADELLDRASQFIKVCETFRNRIKEHLRTAGAIQCASGVKLILEVGEREKINAEKALPILKTKFTDEQLAQAITISKTALMDVAGAAAPRGMKGKVKAELAEALRNANVMDMQIVETIRALRMVENQTLTVKE